jgi:hypothetical protein
MSSANGMLAIDIITSNNKPSIADKAANQQYLTPSEELEKRPDAVDELLLKSEEQRKAEQEIRAWNMSWLPARVRSGSIALLRG